MEEVAAMKEHPQNSNTHNAKQLKILSKVIKMQGWRNPIIVSKRSGFITKGHGRFKAALLLGETQVPVDYQEYKDEDSEIADMIADNKLAELSKRKMEVLEKQLKQLKKNGDVEMSGFTEFEVEDLFKDVIEDQAEIPFSEEILESHNYVVLLFDNEMDWQVAQDKFGLKKAKDLIPRKGQPTGIGRVLRGKDWLERIK